MKTAGLGLDRGRMPGSADIYLAKRCVRRAAVLDSPRAIDAQPGMLLLDRLVLLLLLPPLAGAQAQGKQNQGGGLIGEVFGAGAPGDGGRNGMDHAWDGKTDTWFDCLGPPDNFWD
eukprot:COSAG06_NODE_23605_length_686_cov_2.064736_2_plen_115_part_01